MQREWSKLLWIGIIAVIMIVILYLGYCTGVLGQGKSLLHYVFQCSCPKALENIRVQQLYSEHAEILFSACDNINPIPSPSGQKIAVINLDRLAQSYVWVLPTDEKIALTCSERGDPFWISEDFLFVSWGGVVESVFDLGTKVASPIPLRKDLRLSNGQDALAVLAAYGNSNSKPFIVTDDYIDFISPDGRFFYRESLREIPTDGIYLSKTGEKIGEPIPGWDPVAWVYDGMILRPVRDDYLADPFNGLGGGLSMGEIRFPWLKLRVPDMYNISD